MSNMVDRVAMAIAGDFGDGSEWVTYRAAAEAAIKAMRKPTGEMLDCCGIGECAQWARGAWDNYISAALGDSNSSID